MTGPGDVAGARPPANTAEAPRATAGNPPMSAELTAAIRDLAVTSPYPAADIETAAQILHAPDPCGHFEPLADGEVAALLPMVAALAAAFGWSMASAAWDVSPALARRRTPTPPATA